jgi:FkbM family methyltransferase
VDTGFAVADRLAGVGLGRTTGAVRRLIARAGIARHTVDVDGIAVSGSLSDHGAYLHSLSGPVARSFHLEVFRASLASGATVVDCGAHIGLYALIAARAVGDAGTVVAIEPAPANARVLRANVEDNGFSDRVEVVEAAATRETGRVRLRVSPWLERTGLAGPHDGGGHAIEVAGIALDDVLAGRRFDIAKIDVEGAEAGALAGLERSLSRSPGAVVFVECHPDPMRELGDEPEAWLESLADRGPVEIFDEGSRALVPVERATIRSWVKDGPEAINLRWRPRP